MGRSSPTTTAPTRSTASSSPKTIAGSPRKKRASLFGPSTWRSGPWTSGWDPTAPSTSPTGTTRSSSTARSTSETRGGITSTGRIWRITAKGRPLVEPPNLAGADVPALLDALKLPEAWTRRQAKRLLKERGAQDVAPAIALWVEDLDPQDADYEHHLLEALWTSQAVDAVNAPLLEQVLAASDPRARAAAVRVLYYWGDRVEHADSLLARAARDEHPRVRREAVTALEHRPSADAARTALAVLEQPMDRFLDFALWNTLRTLEPHWLPRLKENPDFLGGPEKLVFALKASSAPYAAGRLAQLYAAGEVPEAYRQDALDALAGYGSADDLQLVFEQALKGGGGRRG